MNPGSFRVTGERHRSVCACPQVAELLAQALAELGAGCHGAEVGVDGVDGVTWTRHENPPRRSVGAGDVLVAQWVIPMPGRRAGSEGPSARPPVRRVQSHGHPPAVILLATLGVSRSPGALEAIHAPSGAGSMIPSSSQL